MVQAPQRTATGTEAAKGLVVYSEKTTDGSGCRPRPAAEARTGGEHSEEGNPTEHPEAHERREQD